MLIVTDSPGKLGNRLQLCATILAYAIEHRHSVVFLSLSEYKDFFQGSSTSFYQYPDRTKVIVPRIKKKSKYDKLLQLSLQKATHNPWLANSLKLKEIKADKLPGILLSMPNYEELARQAKIIVIRGYYYYNLQDLPKHGDRIREFFKPVIAHQEIVKKTIWQARQKGDVLVGVHVRHGDYKNYNRGIHFFSFQEYEKVMQHAQRLFPNQKVHFLVCSDDCLSTETFSSNISWQPGPGTIIGDMYSLAECDYIIGPHSSFNNWSAFYGKVKKYQIQDPSAQFDLDSFHYIDHFGGFHILRAGKLI